MCSWYTFPSFGCYGRAELFESLHRTFYNGHIMVSKGYENRRKLDMQFPALWGCCSWLQICQPFLVDSPLHRQNKQISKEALLAHSKRFQKAMEKNNVGWSAQTWSVKQLVCLVWIGIIGYSANLNQRSNLKVSPISWCQTGWCDVFVWKAS